ncbi:MAG: FAD-dependent oxidoreductase [Cyanobium sp.]
MGERRGGTGRGSVAWRDVGWTCGGQPQLRLAGGRSTPCWGDSRRRGRRSTPRWRHGWGRAGWGQGRLEGWAQEVEIVQEYGLDTNRLGVRATEEGAAYRGGDAMVAGGYVAIVETLLDGVDRMMTSPVSSVRSAGSRVSVMLSSGERMSADVAVVAVPLPIVRDGHLAVADIPRPVMSALRGLSTGNLEKVVLRYDEQWWGDFQVYGIVGGGAPGAPSGSLAALRWTDFYSLTDVLGFPALVGFSGGRAARARPAKDAGCVAEASAALAAAFA